MTRLKRRVRIFWYAPETQATLETLRYIAECGFAAAVGCILAWFAVKWGIPIPRP